MSSETGHHAPPFTFDVSGDMEAEWDRLRRRWARQHRRAPRLLTPLPRHVRLRLAATKVINTTGCWLCDHGRTRLAMLLWRACGMWKL